MNEGEWEFSTRTKSACLHQPQNKYTEIVKHANDESEEIMI